MLNSIFNLIPLDILRDFGVFLIGILTLGVFLSVYVSIKNYLTTLRLEKRIKRFHDADADSKKILEEVKRIEDICDSRDKLDNYFGPMSTVLDLYAASITDRKGSIFIATVALLR